MHRSSLVVLAAFIASSLAAPPSLHADDIQPIPIPPYDVVQLAPGVYGFLWRDPVADPIDGNSLFVINDEDVLVVDSGLLQRDARAMAAELKKLTDKPVRYVVNTHWHDDHNNGNCVYRELWPGVEFVAHRDTRIDMIAENYAIHDEVMEKMEGDAKAVTALAQTGKDADGKDIAPARRKRAAELASMYAATIPDIKSRKPTPPDLTFEDRLVLHRHASGAEREIEIRWLGLGNTRGDTVVFLPKEKIAAVGDLLVWPIPFGFGSYYEEWANTLGRVDALDATMLFPGHGPVHKDREYLRQVKSLLESTVERVREAVNDHASLEETKTRVKLADWRAKFAGADPIRQSMFDQWYLAPAVERTWYQEKGKTQSLGLGG